MTEKLIEQTPTGLKRKKKKSMIGIDPLAWMNEADTESGVTDALTSVTENILEVEVDALLTSEPLDEVVVEEQVVEMNQESQEDTLQSASEEEEVEDMDMQQAGFGLNGNFKLEGPITIADVAILHEKFTASIEHESAVEIDCSDIDGVDAAALQLLLAYALEIEKQNKKITWKDPSDSMLSAVKLMGLSNDFRL